MDCRVEVNQDQYDALVTAEAAVVREYETREGERFGVVLFTGANAECQDVAATPGILLVPNDLKYIGDSVVPTARLLGHHLPEPKGANNDKSDPDTQAV